MRVLELRTSGDLIEVNREQGGVRLRLWPPAAWVFDAAERCWQPATDPNVVSLRELFDHIEGHGLLLEMFAADEPQERARVEANRLLRQLLLQIPIDVRRAVLAYRDYHLPLLGLAHAAPRDALQLLRTAPALAYLVVAQSEMGGHDVPAAQLLAAKRTELLGHVGFAPTRSNVRILSRVAVHALDVPLLLRLREIMRSAENVAHLRHLPIINEVTLELLDGAYARRAKHRLIRAASALGPTPARSFIRLLDDLRRLMTLFEEDLPQLQSFRQVNELHQRFSRMLRHVSRRDIPRLRRMRFAAPPLPARPGTLQPIADARQLLEEGSSQQNCVFSYLPDLLAERDAARPQTYLYRMLQPERCTLELRFDLQEGRYRLATIKKKNNQNVTDQETMACVRAWLAEQPHRAGVRMPPPELAAEAAAVGTAPAPQVTSRGRDNVARQRPAPRPRPAERVPPPTVVGTAAAVPSSAEAPAFTGIRPEDVVEFLCSENPVLRSGALMALSPRLRDNALVVGAVVDRIATDPSRHIRIQAAEKLGALGEPTVLPRLKSINAAEQDAVVRRAVALAIARIETAANPSPAVAPRRRIRRRPSSAAVQPVD